jgi:hypothetical protein
MTPCSLIITNKITITIFTGLKTQMFILKNVIIYNKCIQNFFEIEHFKDWERAIY